MRELLTSGESSASANEPFMPVSQQASGALQTVQRTATPTVTGDISSPRTGFAPLPLSGGSSGSHPTVSRATDHSPSTASVAIASGIAQADGPNTVVFRSPDDSAPGPAAPQATAPAAVAGGTASASTAPAGPAGAGALPTDLDELARRLYEPLSARIKSELWMDRERAGLIADVRR